MKDKRILILGIFILMALAMGITYAYFSAKIIGSETESTLVFDAGTLSINLDGGNTLNGDKMIPGDTPFSTKKFTVIGNNNSNGYMPYSVNLVVDENTYSTDAISYTLELVTNETDNNGVPIENRENTPINYTNIIGSGYFTKGSNIKHTYLLKMYFLDTHTDQSADMKARFNAHIEITGNRASKNKVTVTFDADGGEVETLSKEVVIGSAYGNLPIPTKEGYEFLGWNGKNMFNEESILMDIRDARYEKGYYVFTSASAYAKYSNGNSLPSFSFKENTQYTYSVYGYVLTGDLRLNLRDVERTQASRLIFDITTEGMKKLTSPANTTLDSQQVMTYGINGTIYIKHIQLEEGTEVTEYEPYFLNKYIKVTQTENHTLKAIWKEIE